MENNLLAFRKSNFSDFGEDGIIEHIFKTINISQSVCCEFGASDGVGWSNTRNLILNHHWTGIMIEADKNLAALVRKAYAGMENVHVIEEFVDDDKNSLRNILIKYKLEDYIDKIDFLSIDIDGLDYYVFKALDLKPKVILIEINTGHDPEGRQLLDRSVARQNIGQSWYGFSDIAARQGYSLVAYTGNAFYVRNDICAQARFKAITPAEAYQQFLDVRSPFERQWAYLVNLGLVEPFFKFHNKFLSAEHLGIPMWKSKMLKTKFGLIKMVKKILKPKLAR